MTTAQGRETPRPTLSPRMPVAGRSAKTLITLIRRRPFLLLGLLLLAILGLSLFIGRYPTPYLMSPEMLWQDGAEGSLSRQLLLNLRLPRVLTACLLGMTLAACGTVLQMIFRNPLVEPGLLGVSQGAAFGTAFSIIYLGASALLMEAMATDPVGHCRFCPLFVRCGVAQVPG
jgi:ABC-type Fe3+-siderophore transport system permease subunit